MNALEALRELVAAEDYVRKCWRDLLKYASVDHDEVVDDIWRDAQVSLDMAWEQARRVIEEESDGRQ